MTHSIHATLAALATAVASPAMGATLLEVRGELTAGTCVVQQGGSTAFPMSAVPPTVLHQAGPAPRSAFTITIRCPGAPDLQQLGIGFDGPRAADGRSLALTAASTAKGLGVALFDERGREIELGLHSIRFMSIGSREGGLLNGAAAFRGIGDGSTAGTANAEGQLTLVYR